MGIQVDPTTDEPTLGANGLPLLKDSKGAWRTRSLFLETLNVDTMKPLYTLKPHEWRGYPSFKQLYLEIGDVTEYDFAITVLGSWEHWQRLIGCEWFSEHLTDMRDTLEVKVRSDAIKRIHTESRSNSKGAVGAARWLADRGWTEKKRGRPSKQEIQAEQRRQALIDGQVSDDLDRISIN